MADELMTGDAAEPNPKPLYDKAARKAERSRVNRLSRLPFLYEFALRGRTQALLAGLVQVALVLVVVLVPARLVAGRWLPTGVGLLVLAAAFAFAGLNRYVNAKAGRR